MEGFGKLSWPDGVEYVGQFTEDRFHGQGQYRWGTGKIYNGGWKEGKQHGEGKIIHNSKIKFGIWNDGQRQTEWLKEVDESLSQFSELDSNLNQSISNFSRNKSIKSKREFQSRAQSDNKSAINDYQFHTANDLSDNNVS